ncbi:MAG: hypothetical protein HQL63_08520 [Magnetococcales bacterium]|nr:hypothetical protein [Magnetococcales bacterium]
MCALGALTISIDLELAWGRCDVPYRAEELAAVRAERDIVTRLARLFEKYQVRATWAMVGHLLLDRPAPWQELPHPDLPRPVVAGETRDWLFQLPREMDPAWYGSDLLPIIQAVQPTQEIGSHSFFHIPFDLAHPDAARADLEAVRVWHKKHAIPCRTFVFPRNRVGHLDLLRDMGIQVFRGQTPRWYDNFPSRAVRRLLNLLTFIFRFPMPTVVPLRTSQGLINLPDSMLLLGRNGLRRLVPPGNLIAMACSGLERAARQRRVFHLWFHPSNFTHDTDRQFAVLEAVLARAGDMREQGILDILPMGDHHIGHEAHL